MEHQAHIRAAVAVLLTVTLAVSAGAASAQILGVTGVATTATLKADQDNPVTVTWQVNTTTTYFSNEARVANVVPPLTLAGPLADPQTSDQFVISGAQVKAWLDQGYRVAVVQREFRPGRAGPVTRGAVRFALTGSTLRATREESAFALQRLQLSFPNQTSLALVEPDEALHAFLDVNYSGTGVLEGNWQIAEPGSSEALPIYRTLRREKRSLTRAQHLRVTGPTLPTGRPGRYLLRFCVVDPTANDVTGDPACPDAGPVVEAAYQVLAGGVVERQRIELREVDGPVTAATEFGWSAIDGAVVYQLQVYRVPAPQAEPEFVIGMLLPHEPTRTQLSRLLLERLAPGSAYRWRINALDSQGRVVGQSPFSVFTLAGP